MSDLKKVLSTPVPVPIRGESPDGKVYVDTVYIEPKVIIMIASELLAMLAGAGDTPKKGGKKK